MIVPIGKDRGWRIRVRFDFEPLDDDGPPTRDGARPQWTARPVEVFVGGVATILDQLVIAWDAAACDYGPLRCMSFHPEWWDGMAWNAELLIRPNSAMCIPIVWHFGDETCADALKRVSWHATITTRLGAQAPPAPSVRPMSANSERDLEATLERMLSSRELAEARALRGPR